MEKEHIQAVSLQTLKACISKIFDGFWRVHFCRVGIESAATFCANEKVRIGLLHEFPNGFFTFAVVVNIGGVNHGNAGFIDGLQDFLCFGTIEWFSPFSS